MNRYPNEWTGTPRRAISATPSDPEANRSTTAHPKSSISANTATEEDGRVQILSVTEGVADYKGEFYSVVDGADRMLEERFGKAETALFGGMLAYLAGKCLERGGP